VRAPSVTQGHEPIIHGIGSLLISGFAADGAVCRRGTEDPDLWFSEEPRAVERAKTLCGQCPVQVQCAEQALSTGERWGTWGGLSEQERPEIRRQKVDRPIADKRDCEREGCGNVFESNNPNKKFCSDYCRRYRTNMPVKDGNCRQCGTRISLKRNKTGLCQIDAARLVAATRRQSGGFVTAETNPWRAW